MKGLFNKMLVMVLLGSACSAHAVTFNVNGKQLFAVSLPAYVVAAAENSANAVSNVVFQALSSTEEAVVTGIAPSIQSIKNYSQAAWTNYPHLCIGAGMLGISALVYLNVCSKVKGSRKGSHAKGNRRGSHEKKSDKFLNCR